MESISVAVLEQKAAEAERRLAALEAKLQTSSGAGPSSSELQELRALLVRAKEQSEATEKERAEAVKEAARLAEENAKLRYQVHHLKMSVREGDKRVAALSKA